MISFVIVNDYYLEPTYLSFLIHALNQQTSEHFNTFWINQSPDNADLQKALQHANFPYLIIQPQHLILESVCCWEIPRVLAKVLEHKQVGDYFVYLHKECWPDPRFVEETLWGIRESEANLGSDNIYILNQLRSDLTMGDLKDDVFLEQIKASELLSWTLRSPFKAPAYIYREERWEEDAFCMPVHLAKRFSFYHCINFPLYFQDIFDLMFILGDKPYLQEIHWVRLGQPLIYHLNHPRFFYEYSRSFLAAVKEKPDYFGHLALYDMAGSDYSYQEPFENKQRKIDTIKIYRMFHYMKFSHNGTMTLWAQALDQSNL